MIEPGTVLQERYLIEKQIGEGGMGAVYLAVDQKFESHVAIKETFYKDEELCRAFEREARLLNSSHHPVLPHVSDSFIEQGGHFLVMEYIEGEDVSEILARDGAFPVENVLRWADELLDALDYLHSQDPPIIHRDIKPNNLKLTPRGNIVLLDFGLAKLNSRDTPGVKSVFGFSRTYSPLEQIQGTGTDARSDIFALGATIFHLLTGRPPVDSLARAAAIVAGKPDPIQLASEINPQVSLSVAQVLQTALALNPALRFVSAEAMRQALNYAAKLDSSSDSEKLLEPVVDVAAADNQVLTSAETQNFTALASFAAEAADSSQPTNTGEPNAIQVQISPADSQKIASAHASVGDAPTKVRKASGNPFFIFAAIAAILVAIGFAAWLIARPKSAPKESSQASITESTTVSNEPSEAPAIIAVSPTTKSPSAVSEKKTPIKPETASIENVADKQKTKIEMSEQVKKTVISERSQNQTQKSRPVVAGEIIKPRRDNPARIIETPPASRIETIMTGEPPDEQPRREERRIFRGKQKREGMSQRELEELRRRRTDEVLRRNRQPFGLK